MKTFDYSFLKNIKVPSEFLSMTNIIASLKKEEEYKKEQYPEIFTSLQKIAIIQSVKSSNAIEGILTTDKRIEEIVNQNSAPLNHNEKEIAGYRDALALIHTNNNLLDFNEESILRLHSILLSKTDLLYKGKYKNVDNIIREVRPDGTSSIPWTPVSAVNTPEAMKQLCLAFLDARGDSEIDPLLLIPCVILDFLCIHPFLDGNGRMSRLLTLLLLYQNDFDISRYISFEEQINNHKGSYYEALRLSSINWHENTNDYMPFIQNFMMTLVYCYQELNKRFLTFKSKKIPKAKRVEMVILDSSIPMSKKEIFNMLPDVSITTIERVLGTLLKENKIIKIGTTISARYFKK